MKNYNKNKSICLICNLEFDSRHQLTRHFKTHHNLSIKQYYDKYIKTSNDGYCKTCGKETHFINVTIGYSSFCNHKCQNTNKDVRNKATETFNSKPQEEIINIRNKQKINVKKTMTESDEWLIKRRKTNTELHDEPNFVNHEKKLETKELLYGNPYYSNREKASETAKNRTDEERIKVGNNISVALLNRTDEEKAISLQKERQTKQERHDNPTYNNPEKISEYYKNETEEQKINRLLNQKTTRIKNGKQIPDEQLTFKELYYKKVYALTEKTIKKYFSDDPLLQFRTRIDLNEHAVHVDHIYSIFDGFMNNILPEIIASPSNLRLIPAIDNLKKNKNSDITIDDLFSDN